MMVGCEVGLVVEFTLVFVNVMGLGAGVLRRHIDSNRSFPVMLNSRIFLAACETCDTYLISDPVCFVWG